MAKKKRSAASGSVSNGNGNQQHNDDEVTSPLPEAEQATTAALDLDSSFDAAEAEDEIASPAALPDPEATPARPLKPKQLLPQTAPPKGQTQSSKHASNKSTSLGPRDQQQTAQQSHVSTHKRILEEIRELYAAPLITAKGAPGQDGLCEIQRALSASPLAQACASTAPGPGSLAVPANKITVLVVGNHSAGKSSLINWYVDQKIQRESAAMETSSMSFVTHGRKRETFRGAATVKHMHLEGIDKFDGIMQHLTTEVCDSEARQFPLVDWIDSPGLADGRLQYAFPVGEVIEWLGERADLIFVLLETHGTTTVERTMDVVKTLHRNAKCKSKTHIFLSRSDEVKTEQERLKLISQLSQSLSRVVAQESQRVDGQQFFGEHALEVKTIYRPAGFEATTSPHDFNQIGAVLELIDHTVKSSVQKHCEQLEQHVASLSKQCTAQLELHSSHEQRNTKLRTWSIVMQALVFLLPLALLLYVLSCLAVSLIPRSLQQNAAVQLGIKSLQASSSLVAAIDHSDWRYHLLVVLLGVFALATLFVRFAQRWRQAVASDAQLVQLQRWQSQLERMQKPKTGQVARLWEQYIGDAF